MTTVLAVVGVALFAILVHLQDADDPSVQGGTDAPAVAASTAPSANVSSSATTPAPLPSAASGSASPAQATAPARITTSASLYYGRPFETIEIPGTYEGVDGAATLRVQLRQGKAWNQFPLPVVTEPAGAFTAYVELGGGQYSLRLVDPNTGLTSEVFTLLLL